MKVAPHHVTHQNETTPLVNSNNGSTSAKNHKNKINKKKKEKKEAAYHDIEPSWGEVMEQVAPYIKPVDRYHQLCAIAALISVVIGKVIGILPPLAIKYAVDHISNLDESNNESEKEQFEPVLWAILVYGGLKIIVLLNTAFQDLAQRNVALDAERRFAVATFQHLHTLSLSYHLEKHIGEITRIMNRGSDSISTVISSFLFYVAPTFFETLVVSAIFWKLGTPTVALTTISAVVIYLVFTVMVTKTRISFRRKLIEASDKIGQKETETLINYETVAMFGRTTHEIQQYANLRQDYKYKRMEMLGMFAVLEFGQKFIRLAGTCAGLIIAGMATVYGYGPDNSEKLSAGSFVVIQIYIDQLFTPLTQLGWQYRMITQAFTDLEKAVTMLNRQSEVQDLPNAIEWVKKNSSTSDVIPKTMTNKNDAGCEIVFNNVTFQYKMDSRRRALGTTTHDYGFTSGGVGRHGLRRGRAAQGYVDEGVNKRKNGNKNDDDDESPKEPIKLGGVINIHFKVPAGKTVALVGPSGSGKTTLIRLVLRMYDPDIGSIDIDNHSVKEYKQESLRQNLGVVAQDTILFNATLRDNIIYGKDDATEEEIWNAVKGAALDTFVEELPDKLETLVGERGMKLSGGERQRVGLARCIIKNPDIVLLDEATSNLDSQTERDIQRNISRICQGRTTLMIAHRLSTACRADEIVVLDKGQVVEQGSHDELLAIKNGKYATMWNLQTDQVSEGNED